MIGVRQNCDYSSTVCTGTLYGIINEPKKESRRKSEGSGVVIRRGCHVFATDNIHVSTALYTRRLVKNVHQIFSEKDKSNFPLFLDSWPSGRKNSSPLSMDDISGQSQPLLGSRSASIPGHAASNANVNGSIAIEPATAAGGEEVPHVIDRSVEQDTIPETATYGRNLTWTSAYLLTISRLVGAGIFASPGNIYREVGSPALALLVWLVGAAIAVCGLVVSMELGCMLPRSGGHKVYLEFIYRRPRYLASTLLAVQAIFLQFTAANCIVFSEYLLFALGYHSTRIVQRALAVALITAITLIHGCFLKPGIWIQDTLAWVKLALMAFMAVVGLAALLLPRQTAFQQGENGPSWSQLLRGSVWSWSSVASAILQVNSSFAGADNLTYVLNEVKNPVKTLKRSAPLALLTVTVFYVMMNLAFFIVVPLKEFEKGGELVAALFFERLFGATVGGKALPALVAISAAGNVMSTAFGHVPLQCCDEIATRSDGASREESTKKSLVKASSPSPSIFLLRDPSMLRCAA